MLLVSCVTRLQPEMKPLHQQLGVSNRRFQLTESFPGACGTAAGERSAISTRGQWRGNSCRKALLAQVLNLLELRFAP